MIWDTYWAFFDMLNKSFFAKKKTRCFVILINEPQVQSKNTRVTIFRTILKLFFFLSNNEF